MFIGICLSDESNTLSKYKGHIKNISYELRAFDRSKIYNRLQNPKINKLIKGILDTRISLCQMASSMI
jgi:hypothetical protein